MTDQIPPVGGASHARVAGAWEQAFALAWEAFCAQTTPVGAVVVSPEGDVVASGRGRRYELTGPPGELSNSQIAHAEINALAWLSAERHWDDHQLLTTLEPCAMCHGGALQATIGAIAFAAPDPYGGTASMRFDTPQSRRRTLTVSGPLRDVRGAFATLLHLVWLVERCGAKHHTVTAHRVSMPAFTRYAIDVHRELVSLGAAGDYRAAWALAEAAPW